MGENWTKSEEAARQAECAQQLPPWMGVILEKQNVTQLLKFRSFIENETSLPLSQDPATGIRVHTTVYL